MQEEQRLKLEAYVVALKKSGTPTAGVSPTPSPASDASTGSEARSDSPGRARGSICKSADQGKVYGYYAKITYRTLSFTTRIHPGLEEAIDDHIVLNEIVEHWAKAGTKGSNVTPFDDQVIDAVRTVLGSHKLDPNQFFRSVSICISASHWVGRCIQVYFPTLKEALDATKRVESAAYPPVLVGGHPTPDYTPEKAADQWSRMKKVIVDLQTASGRLSACQAEADLWRLERAHAPQHAQKVWKIHQARAKRSRTFSSGNKPKMCPEQKILRKLEQIIARWARELAKERKARQKKSSHDAASLRKRRWDGVESFQDFKRRCGAVQT
mmetsp:Transcript_11309/g.24925  ORF Transcript_11309/g.24925 Transcript_11309/m.24925 type:complete len:325 (-) Transcript_11309:57-1031(-)